MTKVLTIETNRAQREKGSGSVRTEEGTEALWNGNDCQPPPGERHGRDPQACGGECSWVSDFWPQNCEPVNGCSFEPHL